MGFTEDSGFRIGGFRCRFRGLGLVGCSSFFLSVWFFGSGAQGFGRVYALGTAVWFRAWRLPSTTGQDLGTHPPHSDLLLAGGEDGSVD